MVWPYCWTRLCAPRLAREASLKSYYLIITLPSRFIIGFLVLAGLDLNVFLSSASHGVSEELVEALISDHLEDQDDDEGEHDDGTDDASSNGTTTIVLILVSVGSDVGVSRLALLGFLLVKLSCNGSLFCVNLSNLSIDLLLNFVSFSLAEHTDVSSYDYWDFGVDIDLYNLFVDDKLWTISDGLVGCIQVSLGSISVRSLCSNCLLQRNILGSVVG